MQSLHAMANEVAPDMQATGPIFFWREFEKPYGFLSQWYECAFEHERVTFLTAEMWMMYQKAKLFDDEVRLLVYRPQDSANPKAC